MFFKSLPLQPRLVVGGLFFLVSSTSLAHAEVLPNNPMELGSMLVASAISQGEFRPAETPVRGGFRIYRSGQKLMLEFSQNFKTNDLAPDLKIAFSPSTTPLAKSQPPAYPLAEGTYMVMAPLKATSGAQSYEIPSSIDLARQGSVLIWCEQFNATMAWAPLR